MSGATPTIRDVARLAGVSKSTASRVLSGAETSIPISTGTRQHVLRAAEELGYRPHRGARALSGKNSHLIGVIVRETDDPWFGYLIDVISHAAKDRGYDLVLGNARRDPQEALALRNTMLDMRYCDGLLLCGDLQESPEDQQLLQTMGQDRRLISVSRGSRELSCRIPYVGVDNRAGTCLALEHLWNLGHRRIACISSDRVGDLADRVDAFCQFMAVLGAIVPPELLLIEEHSFDGGYRAAGRLWRLVSPPTAIFGAADCLAVGALASLLDMGVAVPQEASVAGFDDLSFSRFVRPALTTVHEPVEEIGRRAVELITSVVEGRDGHEGDCPQFLLEPRLVVRSSTGPAPSVKREA